MINEAHWDDCGIILTIDHIFKTDKQLSDHPLDNSGNCFNPFNNHISVIYAAKSGPF